MQSTNTTSKLAVNGKNITVNFHPEEPLLYVLRNQIHVNGPKYGCGLGQCGACMVLIDGQATLSCITPASAAEGKEITTLAGLANPDGRLHPLQQAFIDEQAAQCGYCSNGMIISAVSLLNQNKNPSDADIRQAMQNNLCRCGTQSRVIRAIKRAANEMG